MNPPNAFADDATAGSSPTVLLVDDDEVNLLLTSLALRERGFNITEAVSGESALSILADRVVDVIVLETFSSILELETAIEVAKQRGPKVPVVAQLVFDAGWAVPSWEPQWWGRGLTDPQSRIVAAEFAAAAVHHLEA